jgi:hypothetical protein
MISIDNKLSFHCLLTHPQVKGHTANIHPEVSEYLGIPYVAPPVGNLRWRPPQPFSKSSSLLNADKFSSDCPALSNQPKNTTNSMANAIQSTLSQTGHTQSEDCLTVNIVKLIVDPGQGTISLTTSSGPNHKLAKSRKQSWYVLRLSNI